VLVSSKSRFNISEAEHTAIVDFLLAMRQEEDAESAATGKPSPSPCVHAFSSCALD
jgi:hypothetical protein